MQQAMMTIGRLATAAGVGVETIRYYQRRELLPIPSVPAGGRRKYSVVALQQIAFIKRAQDLGFTLDEIKELMRMRDGSRCRDGRDFARRKIAELRVRVSELERMLGSLDALVGLCNANKGAPCPFIEALNSGSSPSVPRRSPRGERRDR